MTREEVVEIMSYCKEHKVTYKLRLEELNIPVWRFYDSKSRYAAEQLSGKSAQGEFIELPHIGSFVPVPSFTGTSGRKQSTPIITVRLICAKVSILSAVSSPMLWARTPTTATYISS